MKSLNSTRVPLGQECVLLASFGFSSPESFSLHKHKNVRVSDCATSSCLRSSTPTQSATWVTQTELRCTQNREDTIPHTAHISRVSVVECTLRTFAWTHAHSAGFYQVLKAHCPVEKEVTPKHNLDCLMKVVSLRAAGRQGLAAERWRPRSDGTAAFFFFFLKVFGALSRRESAQAQEAFVHGASSSAPAESICTRTETVLRDEDVQSSKKWRKLNHDCSHMHLHDNATDTQHHSSDTARSTFGHQAELPLSTGYEPELDCEDNSSNLYVSISSDTVQSSATGSETLCRNDSPDLVMLGTSRSDTLCRNRRLPTEEMPHVPDGEGRLAREVGQNTIVIKVLKHFTPTSSNRDSKSCHADDFPHERPFSWTC